MDGLYGEDLAFIHDAGFDEPAEAAARMVLDLAAPPGLVVDLGCGGGTLLKRLVAAGFEGLGIDASAAMVSMARQRVPQARIEQGDAVEVPLPPCDVLTAVGEVLAYTSDPDGPDPLRGFFARARASVRGGGILLFDLPTFGRAPRPTEARRSGPGWEVHAQTREEGAVLVREIDARRSHRGSMHRVHEVHRLRLRTADLVLEWLEDAGFEATHLGGYDDHGFVEGWDGFLARPR